jgi:hypothetical protein
MTRAVESSVMNETEGGACKKKLCIINKRERERGRELTMIKIPLQGQRCEKEKDGRQAKPTLCCAQCAVKFQYFSLFLLLCVVEWCDCCGGSCCLQINL